MGLTKLIIAALAVWQILEIWHHSSLMASWRDWAEQQEGWRGDLAVCMFCMSPWTASICLILLSLPELPGVLGWLGLIPSWIISAFAVARLANLGNDLTYRWCRTVRHNRELPELPPVVTAESADEAAEEHP